ncbi:MAG: hypothetical protein EBV05_07975 [Cyanobacteria bacterium WB6_1B_304]|nr:hypothetical protein [Cyanobacteria bacterium WB6_1B_304]
MILDGCQNLQGELVLGASQFFSPHPKSISLLSFWEKGLGDEGKLIKLGYSPGLPFSFCLSAVPMSKTYDIGSQNA